MSFISTATFWVPSTVNSISADAGTSLASLAGEVMATFGGSAVSPGAFHLAPPLVHPPSSRVRATIEVSTLRVDVSTNPSCVRGQVAATAWRLPDLHAV
jgi:hypothetical protein